MSCLYFPKIQRHVADLRKRMKVDWYTEIYMIEGVGCAEGYLSHPFFMFIRIPTGSMYGPILVCCEVNGETLYKSPLFDDCADTLVSNETISEISPKSNISFKDGQLKVTFDGDALFDVAVYNMQGMMLLQTNNNRNEMLANLDNLPKGIYIVRFNSGSYVYSQKIVK